MSDELVTVAEFDMVFDAEMAKDYLEDNDIKASVVGDDLIAISPAVGKTMVEVKVFEKDIERAKAAIETHKAQCQAAADEQAKGKCDCDCDDSKKCDTDTDNDCGSDCDCQGDA
jgi:hypothetical protein